MRLPSLCITLLVLVPALPGRAEPTDTGRAFVLETLRATADHYRRGHPVRLGADTFPYAAWARCLWAEGWRGDTGLLSEYDALRRAVRTRHLNIEPFMYLVDALARQAARGDTIAVRDLLRLYRGSDGEMTETIESGVKDVFARRPELVIRAWCAEPPSIELAAGDDRAVARVRRTTRRLVERGVVAIDCAERFLRAVTTW